MFKNSSYQKELQIAIATVQQVGSLLREKFSILLQSPSNEKLAPELKLSEVNQLILDLIQTEFPNDLILGCKDQSFSSDLEASDRTWLIKPHDGKHGFYSGYRNTAVSIALLDGDELVLGVVYAFNYPDSKGDLISWAKGGSLRRNDLIMTRQAPKPIDEKSIVLLPSLTDHHSRSDFVSWISPMKYTTFSSIAYALALVSVGDANIAVCKSTLYKWKITCGNFAAGHALLLAAGMDLFDDNKQPIRYSRQNLAIKRDLIFAGHYSVVSSLPKPVPIHGGYLLENLDLPK